MIIWKKRIIKCCRCHKDYSFDDNLFYHLNDYILVCPKCRLMHKINIQLFGKEYEELKKINRLNLAAINVGSAAIDRTSQFGYANYTLIDRTIPANATGIITSIEIWAYSNMSNVEVAIFYVVSGNNLSTRSNVTLGSVTKGSKQTFTLDSEGQPISLSVVTGDYIGIYSSAGYIEATYTGSVLLLYKLGDNIPCTNTVFSIFDNMVISVRGTGVTLGWPHKWNGVTIGKLNGAVINKWNGIA